MSQDRSQLQRESSTASEILSTLTTVDCEVALMNFTLLLELQSEYLSLEDDTLTSHNQTGGYNLFCDGSALINGRQCKVFNFIKRNVTLKSHADNKDYRETLISKPMLFLTNGKKINNPSSPVTTYAFIVNTRHPKIKKMLLDCMNNVISSVWGENHRLQISFQNIFNDYFRKQNFEATEENLSFSYTFKLDVLLDVFYLFGLSNKKSELNVKILYLYSSKKEKIEHIRKFLTKISNPIIRMGSTCDRDRRKSSFALDVILEDPFPPEEIPTEYTNDDTLPVLAP